MSMKRLKQLTTVSLAVAALSMSALWGATSELADAAKNKNKAAVQTLLLQKADVNATLVDGTTALHWAAYWEDSEMADRLIAAGANVNATSREGATPLSIAATTGYAPMLEKLLAAGANPNASVTPEGDTVLMLAARSGKVDAVKVLLGRKVDVNVKETFSGTTALMWAASESHSDNVQALIAGGADVNLRSKIVGLPGRGTAPPGAKPRDAQANEAPQAKFTGGLTALMLAARQGDLKSAEALLAAGANPNIPSGDGSAALQIAINNGNYAVASLLIDKGADVNQADANAFTPLFTAVHVRTMDRSDTIPWTVTDDPLPVIEKLLAKGADPNVRVKDTPPNRMSGITKPWIDLENGTAFLRAAFSGDLTVMRLLLKYGADPGIQTKDHTTALMLATGLGVIPGYQLDRSLAETLEATKLLVELGNDVNAANDAGRTALHGAASRGRNETVQLLVDLGGRLDVYDKGSADSDEPLMPIDYAIGVRVNGQSAWPQPQTETFMRKLMADRGIKHTTSECTLRGFTCGEADPNKLDAKTIEEIRQKQLAEDANSQNSNLQPEKKPLQ